MLIPLMAAALSLAAPLQAGPSLEGRIRSVMPQASEEKWLTIGWRTDLGAARKEAAKTGKPLFLWIMNGHPLGCT